VKIRRWRWLGAARRAGRAIAVVALLAVAHSLWSGTATATTTTSSASAAYSYDQVSCYVRATDRDVFDASGRLPTAVRGDDLLDARLSRFLAAEEETAAVRGFQTYTNVLLTGEVKAGRTSVLWWTSREHRCARRLARVQRTGFGRPVGGIAAGLPCRRWRQARAAARGDRAGVSGEPGPAELEPCQGAWAWAIGERLVSVRGCSGTRAA
jgi:hypothetical protein